MIRWQCCAFSELSPAEMYAVLAVRSAVFVVEQHCAFQDLDGFDLAAMHWVAWSGAEVAGYLRIVAPSLKFRERSIGRVLTSEPFRASGLGRELMARALQDLDARFPTEPVRIGAQARLEAFYAAFGFVRASDVYVEDGIPHIEMLRAGR
jgi:ElaA protein